MMQLKVVTNTCLMIARRELYVKPAEGWVNFAQSMWHANTDAKMA